jgi:hypothetical protein
LNIKGYTQIADFGALPNMYKKNIHNPGIETQDKKQWWDPIILILWSIQQIYTLKQIVMINIEG